jgi:hypothetical protein
MADKERPVDEGSSWYSRFSRVLILNVIWIRNGYTDLSHVRDLLAEGHNLDERRLNVLFFEGELLISRLKPVFGWKRCNEQQGGIGAAECIVLTPTTSGTGHEAACRPHEYVTTVDCWSELVAKIQTIKQLNYSLPSPQNTNLA